MINSFLRESCHHDRPRNDVQLGDGTGPPLAVRFTTVVAERGVVLDPELKLGESYMDGTLIVEQGSIADVLAVLQSLAVAPPFWARPLQLVRYLHRRLKQLDRRPRARRNVAHHYDLDDRLYSLFLDSDRQYSCAYFETPDQSLDDAQLAKRRRLAAKLLVASGQRVLDIGCGCGGLALYLAETCDSHVTGITLSKQQLAVAHAKPPACAGAKAGGACPCGPPANDPAGPGCGAARNSLGSWQRAIGPTSP